QRGGAAR
ncbi:hypothetical protein MKD33_19870, partial [Chromobacterium piscinae]